MTKKVIAYNEDGPLYILLKLLNYGNGVDLVVVDDNGNELKTILSITPDGLYRWSNGGRDYFPVDGNGRINLLEAR